MAAGAPSAALLGGDIGDDVLLCIIGFLPTAKDLLRLELTSPHFGEVARRWVAGCTEQERGWVRTTASWLGAMHHVELLRLPLKFGRAHPLLTLSANGATATKRADTATSSLFAPAGVAVDESRTSALSKGVMRSGRHFAQFTLGEGSDDMLLGVLPPGWDVEGAEVYPMGDFRKSQ